MTRTGVSGGSWRHVSSSRTLDLEADPAEIEGARERLENGLPEAETITAENNAAEDLATENSNP